MRKLLLGFTLFLVISLFFTFTPKALAAGCKLTITPNPLDSQYKGDLSLVNDTPGCFAKDVKYFVIAYPNSRSDLPAKAFEGNKFIPFAQVPESRKTGDTIAVSFNLGPGSQLPESAYIQGKNYPGNWTFAVCRASSQLGCKDSNNFVGTGVAKVNAFVPTPTQTPDLTDLPVIDKSAQSHCAYQSGKEATVYKIIVKPSTKYNWWWDKDTNFQPESFTTNATQTEASFTIPTRETAKVSGEKKFCVDTEERINRLYFTNFPFDTNYYCQENGIKLFFTAAPPTYPDDDKKCDAAPPPSTTICARGEQSHRFTSECIRPDTGSPCLGTEGVIEFLKCKDDGTGYEHVSYSCSIYAPKCTSGCKYAVGQECTSCAIQTTYSCNDVATASATSCFTSIYCGNFSSTVAPTSIITPPPCKKWVDVNNKEIATSSALVAGGHAKCAAFDTAFGDIATDQTGLIRKIFTVILSLSGGIALLLIIYSGYQLAVSRGNPEKIQGAKETITSAIVGLLFVIFSVAILQIIGVEILRIPGFSP